MYHLAYHQQQYKPLLFLSFFHLQHCIQLVDQILCESIALVIQKFTRLAFKIKVFIDVPYSETYLQSFWTFPLIGDNKFEMFLKVQY